MPSLKVLVLSVLLPALIAGGEVFILGKPKWLPYLVLASLLLLARTQLSVLQSRDTYRSFRDWIANRPNYQEYLADREREESGRRYSEARHMDFEPLILLAGTLAIVWLVPAVIVLWIVRSSQIDQIVKVATLLASISGSVLFYRRNRSLFPSAADKATYFSATFLVPVGIVSVLLD